MKPEPRDFWFSLNVGTDRVFPSYNLPNGEGAPPFALTSWALIRPPSEDFFFWVEL